MLRGAAQQDSIKLQNIEYTDKYLSFRLQYSVRECVSNSSVYVDVITPPWGDYKCDISQMGVL